MLPTETGDQLAIAVVVLDLLDRVHLGPQTDPDVVADALDEVAVSCSPHQDLAVNPAKILAIGIADSNPILWGGTVLAARAARRIAESIRRATGRTALAADAEHLLPVLEATAPGRRVRRPVRRRRRRRAGRPWWCSTTAPATRPSARPASALEDAARDHGVRVETISSEADGDVARYAAMLSTGTYAAAYLQLGLDA